MLVRRFGRGHHHARGYTHTLQTYPYAAVATTSMGCGDTRTIHHVDVDQPPGSSAKGSDKRLRRSNAGHSGQR